MILSQLILFAYVKVNGDLSLKFFIDKKILWELFNIGFPIMILWSVIFLMTNIDKFIVFLMLGKTKAGYYGLAAFVSSIGGYISYTTSSVLFPRMMYVYGKTKNKTDIEKYYKKPMMIISGIIPIILGIIYINIKMFINLLLPEYTPAVTVLHILIVALFFSTIWGLPLNLLIALNKQKKILFVIFILLIIGIILNIVVIKIGYGVIGVAAVTTFVFLLFSVAANAFALFFLKNNLRQILKNLLVIYLPFVFSFIVIFFIVSLSISANIIVNNLIKTFLYIVFSLPVIFYIEKKSRIVGKIFSLLRIFK